MPGPIARSPSGGEARPEARLQHATSTAREHGTAPAYEAAPLAGWHPTFLHDLDPSLPWQDRYFRRGGCHRRPVLLIGVSRRVPEEVRHGVLTLSFVFKMVAPSSLLGRLSKVPGPVAFA